jgi:hypothetical protein
MRLDLTQLLHMGFSSPHLIRRFRHAMDLSQSFALSGYSLHCLLKQPVLTRLFGALRCPECLTVGSVDWPMSTEAIAADPHPSSRSRSRSSFMMTLVEKQIKAIGSCGYPRTWWGWKERRDVQGGVVIFRVTLKERGAGLESMARPTPQVGQSCRASQITRDPRCATLLSRANFDFYSYFSGLYVSRTV